MLSRRTERSGRPASLPTVHLVPGAVITGVGLVASQFSIAPCAENPALAQSARVVPVYYALMGVLWKGLVGRNLLTPGVRPVLERAGRRG